MDNELTMREKLIDVHGKLMGLLQRAPYIGCADTDRQYAVNWLMNNGVTVQEWISVKDRLPEPFVSVLACIPSESPLPTVHESYIADHGAWVCILTA